MEHRREPPQFAVTMVDGVRIESQRPLVPSERPPIVLVHGGCHGSWYWRRFQPLFAERGWETHALNWYQHNGSRSLDRRTFVTRGLADIVEEVSIVARTLVEPPIVIGHSMGGMVAQKFVEATGGSVALVLLAAVAPAAVEGEPKDLTVDLAAPWGPPPFEIAQRMFFPENDEAEAREYFALLCPESPLCVHQATRSPPDIDVARVRCPVLVIGGETDVLIPAAVVERTARL